MPKPYLKYAGGMAAAAVLAAALVLGFGDSSEPLPSRPKNLSRPAESTALPTSDRPLAMRLSEAGWDAEAAAAVAELNRDFFAAVRDDSPAEAERLIDTLATLGSRPGATGALARRPELAGLLCGLSRPDDFIRAYEAAAKDDRVVLVNLMVLNPDPADRTALIAAFRRRGGLIARMHRAGLFGAEALFLVPRETEADRTYDDWLAEGLDVRLAVDGEGLAPFIQVVQEHGPGIRRRLRENSEFRRRFRDELWPSLQGVASTPGNPLEVFLDSPAVWDVLMRPDGKPLLEKRGMLAVALLCGPNSPPREVHDRVVRLLLAGDGDTFLGLVEGKYRREPQFQELLKSSLPDELIIRAIAALSEAGDRYAGKLVEFVLLKDSAARLEAKLGPKRSNPLEWLPFYLQVVVAKKLVTGERVTDEEWIELLVDSAASAIPFGKGGKAVRQTLKQTLKQAAEREIAERAAAERLGAAAARAAAGNIAGRAGGQAARREIGRWGATGMMAEFQGLAKNLTKHGAVDITPMVRMMYERSGLGRKLFRQGTDLEARIFMRGDAHVLIQFDQLAYRRTREYLEETVKETAKETLRDMAAEGREQLARRNTAAVLLLENRIGADALPPR